MVIMEIFNYILLFGPLISGLILTLFTINKKQITQWIAVIASGITGLFACFLFLSVFFSNVNNSFFTFLTIYKSISGESLILSVQLDSLSRFMVFVASFLGMLIVIFSIEYMHGDNETGRYYFFIQFFILSMVLLVSAGDFLTMFIGWELVGLCSFFLIGHWYSKDGIEGEKCAKSGMKAFIFTRFGDIGFLTAIVVLFANYGTLEFSELAKLSYSPEILTVLGILFVFAAFGKSAQLPFMPWLSSPDSVDIDAMQGPTTVSALIHAATMVKAGIYLISRVFLLFPLGLSILFGSWSIIVIIAGFTAIIAGLSALVSMDIKRILAYSTVSQLSFMFLSIGLAFTVENNSLLSTDAFYATQLHLLAHAFFKSLLFLAAGYIIHTYHSRNLNDLRGVLNWKQEKAVMISFIIGGLALAGIPPMNGFFSKDSIVSVAYEIGFIDGLLIGKIAFIFIIVAAIITALYTGRLLFNLTFKNELKINKFSKTLLEKKKSHNSVFMPGVISIIAILTIISSIFSFIIPGYFSDILTKQPFEIIKASDILLPIITLMLVSLSIALTVWLLSTQNNLLDKLNTVFGIDVLINLSKNGFYFDALIMGLWKKFESTTNRLKYIHTGDLNNTVLLMSGFSLVLILAFLLGGI